MDERQPPNIIVQYHEHKYPKKGTDWTAVGFAVIVVMLLLRGCVAVATGVLIW